MKKLLVVGVLLAACNGERQLTGQEACGNACGPGKMAIYTEESSRSAQVNIASTEKTTCRCQDGKEVDLSPDAGLKAEKEP